MLSPRLLSLAALLAGGIGIAAEPEKKPMGPISFVLHTPSDMVRGPEDNPGLGAGGVLRQGQRGWLEANFETRTPSGKQAAIVKARTLLDRTRKETFPLELEFPHEDAAQAPLRVSGALRLDMCCGSTLEGSIPVPAQARLGTQKVRVSWKEFRGVVAGSCTVEIDIRKAE